MPGRGGVRTSANAGASSTMDTSETPSRQRPGDDIG